MPSSSRAFLMSVVLAVPLPPMIDHFLPRRDLPRARGGRPAPLSHGSPRRLRKLFSWCRVTASGRLCGGPRTCSLAPRSWRVFLFLLAALAELEQLGGGHSSSGFRHGIDP